MVEIRIKELIVDEIIHPPTNNMLKESQGGTKMVVIGKPGCFAKDTKVLMYDGSIKNIQDIVIGDGVMGDDSTIRTVTDVCFGNEEMYTIHPKFGQSVCVNKSHILSLIKINGIKDRGIRLNIKLEDFLNFPPNIQNNWGWYRTNVKFKYQPTTIDPYLYGFISNGSVNLTKQHYLQNCGYQFKFYKDYISTSIVIPTEYYINSIKTRISLLSGIIDSYGTFNKITKRYMIESYSEEYIDQLLFICSSLGYYSSKINNWKSNFITNESNIIYTCYIYPNVNQMLQTRILNPEYNNIEFSGYFTTPFQIEKKYSNQDYYGIEIDDNHLFLLSDCSVVHNTGKTTLISSLFYEKKHIFPIGQIYSGTEDSNGFWQTIFPSTFVFNKLNVENIEKLIKRQKYAKKHLPNPWAILLLDDCTDDPKLLNTPLFQNIFKNGRHWKMLFILSLQYAGDIRPVIRTNVDVVFILREPNIRNRMILYNNYASCIPSFSIFCEIMDFITVDYTALVINNASISNDWTDNVFYYKAKVPPSDFKMGSKAFWEYHYNRCDPDKNDLI
jgi:hypothetical protein